MRLMKLELKFEESENGVKRLWLSDEFTTMEISQYISSVEISADARETEVRLTFHVVQVAAELKKTVAEVDYVTRDLLLTMGWTPPS